VKIYNAGMLNVLIYRSKNDCSWHDLPKEFGSWHGIDMRFPAERKTGYWKRYMQFFAKKDGNVRMCTRSIQHR